MQWNPLDPLDVEVGMEGCQTALNATNAIRTAWFFRCRNPIHLINVQSFDEIHAFQRRDEGVPSSSISHANVDADLGAPSTSEDRGTSTGVVQFGATKFDGLERMPLTLIENFATGAQSIHSQRVVFSSDGERVLIGHENHGIQDKYWGEAMEEGAAPTPVAGVDGRASCVVANSHCEDSSSGVAHVKSHPRKRRILYLPQWGTVSSVNVVSCLGLVLFYASIDRWYPAHRTLLPKSEGVNNDASTSGSLVRSYHAAYRLALPKQQPPQRGLDHGGDLASLVTPDRRPSQGRVDSRPIHPVYYQKSLQEIDALHKRLLEDLKTLEGDDVVSFPRNPKDGRPLFGTSLLYENDVDQRNFGGIIRNANAFLADHVFYVGRRKLNVVGAVGCHHYVKPVYLGGLPPAPEADCSSAGVAWLSEMRRHFSLDTRNVSVWFLSCGQEFLYEPEGNRVAATTEFLESYRWFDRLRGLGKFCSLSDSEERIRNCFAAVGRDEQLVLLVPQEGRLPHPSLLRLCSGIVTVALPCATHDGGWKEGAHRGLPAQVASAIALHRLTTVLHRKLRW